ncbi:MAG: hypothetical protein FWC70_13260 [Defluviitaleaceae bacterium]|nr:hypothetical protein [Defluviitaleaceae bacterium]
MTIDDVNVLWNEITRDQLKHLSYEQLLPDSAIAQKFGISVSKVRYKRKKFNLSAKTVCIEKFADENSEIYREINKQAKEWFTDAENLDSTARAIAGYVFRNNGVTENFHAKYKIPDEDMKMLNICIVNRIAGLLKYAASEDWNKLRKVLAYCNMFTTGWNPAEPDTEEFEKIYALEMEKVSRNL